MTAAAPKLMHLTPRPASPPEDRPETPAAQAARLLGEARDAAGRQVDVLQQAMAATIEAARAVEAGGEAYPAGLRDLAGRLAIHLAAVDQSAQAIRLRTNR